MLRIILIILAGVVAVAAAWWIASLPGHVTLMLGKLSIATSTPVAVLAAVLLFLAIYLVIRIIAFFVHAPRGVGLWRGGRRRRLGNLAVTHALLALAAGDKADARRSAGRARRLLGDSPQTLLLAAEAGRLAGREDEEAAAFRLLSERKDAAFLGYRGLLRQAVARGDWAEAAELARQAEAAHPGASWLREQRAQLAVRAGNWSEALELADVEAPKAALAVAAAQAELDRSRALRLAQRAWKADPSLAPAAVAYAERLRADGRERRAIAVLTHSWTLAPHPDIAACALAPVTDKLARTQAAQKLTASNPEHAESRLLLARTSLEAGLTGEARHQAEAARAAGVNERRLWLLLAEIEEAERGETEEGRLAQRDALRQAAAADPDPGWRCSACHTPHTAWHPACPACGEAGTVRWRSGVAVPALL